MKLPEELTTEDPDTAEFMRGYCSVDPPIVMTFLRRYLGGASLYQGEYGVVLFKSDGFLDDAPDVHIFQATIVLNEGETPDQAAEAVAGQFKDLVDWSVEEVTGQGGWPEVTYYGDPKVLDALKHRYSNLGVNKGINKGKPSVGKGQKRV
jgi:hypothetical protein